MDGQAKVEGEEKDKNGKVEVEGKGKEHEGKGKECDVEGKGQGQGKERSSERKRKAEGNCHYNNECAENGSWHPSKDPYNDATQLHTSIQLKLNTVILTEVEVPAARFDLHESLFFTSSFDHVTPQDKVTPCNPSLQCSPANGLSAFLPVSSEAVHL